MRDYQKQEEHGEAAEVAGKGSDPAQEEEFDLFKLASSASLAMILKGPTKTWQNLKAFVADNSLTASGETIDEHVALASLKVQLRKSTRSLIEKSGLLKPAEEFRSRQVEKTISSIFSTLADTLFGLILSDHEVREVGCLLYFERELLPVESLSHQRAPVVHHRTFGRRFVLQFLGFGKETKP